MFSSRGTRGARLEFRSTTNRSAPSIQPARLVDSSLHFHALAHIQSTFSSSPLRLHVPLSFIHRVSFPFGHAHR
jgi:hypothetical protein